MTLDMLRCYGLRQPPHMGRSDYLKALQFDIDQGEARWHLTQMRAPFG